MGWIADIKVKEQSVENMLRSRKVYEPPRYMTVNQCVSQLLEVRARPECDSSPPHASQSHNHSHIRRM